MLRLLKYVIAWTATSGLALRTLVTTNGEKNQMAKARMMPAIQATQSPSAVTVEACMAFNSAVDYHWRRLQRQALGETLDVGRGVMCEA